MHSHTFTDQCIVTANKLVSKNMTTNYKCQQISANNHYMQQYTIGSVQYLLLNIMQLLTVLLIVSFTTYKTAGDYRCRLVRKKLLKQGNDQNKAQDHLQHFPR